MQKIELLGQKWGLTMILKCAFTLNKFCHSGVIPPFFVASRGRLVVVSGFLFGI